MPWKTARVYIKGKCCTYIVVRCDVISSGYLAAWIRVPLPEVRDVAHGTWVIGSILHGGPIELFLVPARAPRLV